MKKLLTAAVLAFPLFAQTHSETITVEVIDVPVYVYNAHGALQNLKKDDFELYVNGKPQTIAYFDPIDFRAPAKTEAVTPAAPPRDIRNRRLFLLILDCAYSRPAAIDRARKAAVAMIDASAPADYFSVATFTSKHGLQLLTPFTNDHLVAKRAAMALQASSLHDPLAIAISANEREQAEVMAILNDDSAARGASDDAEAAIAPLIGAAAADNAKMQGIRLIEDQLTDYRTIANRIAPFEGYKHVVLMSEGFSHERAYSEARLMQDMKSMASAFRNAGAVVDTIDLGGTMTDEGFRDSLENDALHLMARETGGQFVTRQNNLEKALNQISAASAVGYRLGFNMPKDAKKGDNTIDVKVRNVPSGTAVSFRRGFSTTVSKPSAADGLLLADVILNDVPQTGLAPRIRFAEKPNVEVWIPAQKLLAINNGSPVNADVMFYIFDAKGAVVEFKEKKLVIPSDARRDIAFRDAIHLPSGSYVAKALLRAGDSLGFVKQEFAVP
ncbi:MAG TPA: VWA domain-containing protein [Thermoanaerobaculia bacterium]|nr:VWA domain-containing protein [Thermoanaerobaculia bacterium]